MNVSSPTLLVIIDAEEEFDWSKPHSRTNTSVNSMAHQDRAQEVFARHGVIPIYVIDYPVATTEMSIKVLSDLHRTEACEIGAHLHPWVNPPYEEDVNAFNSYPGNLPPDLEREKLRVLTETIDANLGVSPRAYKAGRYGIGPATAGILADLGYDTDLSVVPHSWFTADGGPDFRGRPDQPHRFGPEGHLLEIPLTVGFCGAMRRWGPSLYPTMASPIGMRLHLPGIMARTGLLERIRLSPEGATLAELKSLTRALVARGDRVFSLTYHSPSLMPGCTPYVGDKKELEGFLRTLDGYLRFFREEISGQPATPAALLVGAADLPEVSR